MAKRAVVKPASQPPAVISSTRELAAAVGRSQTAIVKDWLKHPEWPYGPGPWPRSMAAAMKQWAARTLAPNPAGESSGESAGESPEDSPGRKTYSVRDRAALARIRTELIKQSQALAQLHRVDECQLRRVRQIQMLKNRFAEVDGLPLPPESIEIVRRFLDEIMADFNRGPDGQPTLAGAGVGAG